MNCDCPSCGSKSTKALSVLHQDGTRISTSSRNGWWLGSGGRLALTRSKNNGVSQSLTARNAAPPPAASSQFLASGLIPVSLVASLLVGGGNVFIITLAVLLFIAVLGTILDARSYGETMTKWENSFRCNRCGLVYEVIVDQRGH